MVVDGELHSSNRIIELELRRRAEEVERLMGANLLSYIGPIDDVAQSLVKVAIESIEVRRRRLVVNLETNGGLIESAERIAHTLRHHYPRTVDFVVTTYAMSAGTVLVMAGDNIFMDYSATLGPIDPQLSRPGSGMYVPALGYLEQFNRLIEKSAASGLTKAEMAYLLNSFDPAELYRYEQARELSIALLEEWLVKYKFKNWKETKTRRIKVTTAMKKQRAAEIAKKLNATEHWHSHSRGISMAVARRDLNLQIEDLEDTPEIRDALAAYNSLLLDYRMRRGHGEICVDWTGGYIGN
ncbi:MAG: ATP-dependent Clp protease proteolytic subunit [Actinomycetia bacterium]|nr:ATP-dependent Clp protease proteolytic subunit [Actinomycetes bacterium]